MSDLPILITGAGGFICSEVAATLATTGQHVIATDRNIDTPTAARLKDVEQIAGPLTEVLTALAGRRLSAVIHGAATTTPPEALGISRSAHLRLNFDPLTQALDTARSAGATKFLFLSSMGVFAAEDGPAPGGKFTEATVPTAECAYCVAKRVGEIVTAAAAEPGFESLSLRLGNTCGPREAPRDTRPRVSRLRRMIDEADGAGLIKLPTPNAMREWSWLPDLAQGIAALMAAPFGPRPVLHTGTPPSLQDLDLAKAVTERRPGTEIRITSPPEQATRPPMGTNAADGPFASLDWTPIPQILDQLMPIEAMS
ncbi:MAG: NAD(P)-dependent oxidoreductase [Pseudomonadota bacterium]